MCSETMKMLTFILENRDSPVITEFEKELINDRFDAFKLYGSGCIVTDKQESIIGYVYEKVRLSLLERL